MEASQEIVGNRAKEASQAGGLYVTMIVRRKGIKGVRSM